MMARDTNQFITAVDYILDLMTAGHQQTVASKNLSKLLDTKIDEGGIEMDDPLNVITISHLKDQTICSPTHTSSTTSTNFISKPHFEIIDIGGGAAVKIVSNEACALTAALTELIKASSL